MANDTNSAMDNLFQAIDIIVGERLSGLKYDRTIKVTIIDDSQASKGIYTVTDGSSNFTAICAPENTYVKGAIVYAVIPEGDWDKDLIIVGRFSNDGDDYFNYANTSEDFLDFTHNLIPDVKSGSLLANDINRPYVRIWSADNLNHKEYNRLLIRGEFRTWLSSLDVDKGSYGLRLYVVARELLNGKSYERTFKFDLLSDDMYGDPFNFETYYLQEKVFDISHISDICYMELLLVQSSDFYNKDNELVPYKNESGQVYPDNIFVKNPYVSLGYDIHDVLEDEVRLYTFDDKTYDSTNPNTKTMHVRWLHMQEDETMIAIDKEDEIPANSVIRWYQHILDRTTVDKLAGTFWKEIEEARNKFEYKYTFTDNDSLRLEQFKVIIESPSRTSVIENLETQLFDGYDGYLFDDKYLGDSQGTKFLDEETEKLDTAVLKRALHSYNRNDYLSFQEYKQVIEDYNKNYKQAHNGVDYDVNTAGQNYVTASDILSSIQREMSNVQTYESEVLEFENQSYDPVASAIDLISGLEILVDPANYNGSYMLYDDSGMIRNPVESTRKRFLTATYESLITGEQTLDTAEKICWYIPLENTMILPPQEGIEYTKYESYTKLTDEEVKLFKFPCSYCRIERDFPVSEGDAGELLARQAEQSFRIKDYYNQNATNNTIYCSVIKNGKTYDASALLTFGIAGTNGTDATFLLQMFEMDGDTITDNPVTAVTLGGNGIVVKPKFYDYNNEDITEEYLSKHTVVYSWYKYSEKNGLSYTTITDDKNINYCVIKSDATTTIEDCQYYILSASVNWGVVKYKRDENGDFILDNNGQPILEEKENGDIVSRDVSLRTFLPIPVRKSVDYGQIIGPTRIIYDHTGANPSYSGDAFTMYKDGKKFDKVEWAIACHELRGGANSAVLNYYPTLDPTTGKMTPKNMYLLGNDNRFAVECLDTSLEEPEIIWTQPILIIQNKYSSAMLNSWDGEFYIDEKNGTIMSTMVGAGKKESDNTFSGVLMGDVAAGAGFDDRNKSGLGLYGFLQGEQSFGFNVDGTAFIGRAGRGRINFNGQNGTIESGSYTQYLAGMQIDLDGDDTDKTASSLFAYGSGGAFELNTNSNKPLLVLRSTPNEDGNILFYIGNTDTVSETPNRKFYLQSENYVPDTDGTHIDLQTGKIYIYNQGSREGELTSYIKINGDGSPYLQIHDGSTTIRENGTDIFYASKTEYYLMSANYEAEKTGIYIDLRGGSIDARSGIIGGWSIGATKLEAGNIIIDSAGSISAKGDAGEWSINDNGSATFTQLTVTGDKESTIGPFKVSTKSLSYNEFSLGVNGINLNNTFTVDMEGNLYAAGNTEIGGNLKVSGTANLTGSMSPSGSGSFSSGGGSGGGGGFYNFGSSAANIGPWEISEEAISTTTGSVLGSKGTMTLSNGVSSLSFNDSSMDIVMGDKSSLKLASGNVRIDACNGSELVLYETYSYLNAGNGNSRLWLGGSTDTYLKGGDTKLIVADSIGIDDKVCPKETTINIRSFLNKGVLKFYKGMLVESSTTANEDTGVIYLDGDVRVRGHISAYKPDADSGLTSLGKLAFMNEVKVTSANFKIGTSNISIKDTKIDGDTVTYEVGIPGQSYSGSQTSVTVYAFKHKTTHAVYISTDPNPKTDYEKVAQDSFKANTSGGSTQARTLTATFTVKAER